MKVTSEKYGQLFVIDCTLKLILLVHNVTNIIWLAQMISQICDNLGSISSTFFRVFFVDILVPKSHKAIT